MATYLRHVAKNCGTIASVFASLLFVSCEEVIDLELDQVKERIVIEGVVSDKPSASNVKISFTESIYTRSNPKSAGGATVILSDDHGNSEFLRESQPGVYTPTTIVGTVNRDYRLRVILDGMEYSATSRMPGTMVLDSVRASAPAYDILFGYATTLTYYLTNKPGVEEYCMIRALHQNGSTISWMLFSDKHSDGKQVALESSLSTSSTIIRVELIAIDKAAYEFYRTLRELVGEDGMEVPDVLRMNEYNPRSNISNNALGYFSAQSQRDYVVNLR